MSQFSNKRKLTDAEEDMVLERIKAGDKVGEVRRHSPRFDD